MGWKNPVTSFITKETLKLLVLSNSLGVFVISPN